MMNSVTVKIQIVILFLLAACTPIEPVNTLEITTDEIILFTEGVYVFNGTLVSIGEEEITDHGFCWSESVNPVTDNTSIHQGPRQSGGRFSYTVSGLSANTTYYVRAFAVAGSVTYYGEERSFTTPETIGLTVTDIDHNIYPTVNIGDQIWMAENLKVTRYPDGSDIPLVESQKAWYDFQMDQQAFCWYENYGALGTVYGGLYTWRAAMHGSESNDANPGEVQGVCPDGWHLPSDSEWKQLEMFLGMSEPEAEKEDWRGTTEGGKMKAQGTQYWSSPNTGATDESGFRALAGGFRYGDGYFRSFGMSATFWSSSSVGHYAWIRRLDYNSSGIYRTITGPFEGHSVRCVKDQ